MGTSIIRNSDIISVYRPTVTTDTYNREISDWTSPTLVVQGKGSIQHYLALEEEVDRMTETEAARLFTDTEDMQSMVQPRDRVVYAGRTWEVTSPPEEFRFFGRYHHTEMFVRLIEG